MHVLRDLQYQLDEALHLARPLEGEAPSRKKLGVALAVGPMATAVVHQTVVDDIQLGPPGLKYLMNLAVLLSP